MINQLHHGGTPPAHERVVSSDPAPATAFPLASAPLVADVCSKDGSQLGFILTPEELSLAYHTYRSF